MSVLSARALRYLNRTFNLAVVGARPATQWVLPLWVTAGPREGRARAQAFGTSGAIVHEKLLDPATSSTGELCRERY